MDWIKKNPFLAGFSACVALILGVGGYLVASAATSLEEQQASFDQKTAQLQALWGHKPYPSDKNIKAANAELEEADIVLDELAKSLAVDVPDVTPQGFMDQLSQLVKGLSEKASAKNVALPEKFFLGFGRYETQLPSAELAPKLALQLRTIHAVASILVESGVESIGEVLRASVEGEEAVAAVPQDGTGPARGAEKSVLEIAPFDVSFVADQSSFRLAFNRISDLKPPVFVRQVAIENSSPGAPPKSKDVSADAGAEASQAGEPGSSSEGSAIRPVVGRENLKVNLQLGCALFPAPKSEGDKK
ncbi:MAG: hypothetical protein ACKOEI_12155 [Chthoniobacterales bacterium]